jgi:hypothetical protein
MKISQLSTDRAMDLLCEIATPVTNIMTDEELIKELKSAVDFEKANTMAEKIALTTGKFTKILPLILKKRKADLFSILASLNEKTIEEIGSQNVIKTMSQIKDIAKDKELLDFFKSCTGTEESE